jgi:hypothetical protein
VAKRRTASAGMQWKTFWAVVAPIGCGGWVAVWLLTGAAVWLAALLTALLAIGICFGVRLLVRVSPMFARLGAPAKARVTGWIVAAVLVYAAWAVLAVMVPGLWLVWAPALPVLGAITWVMARAHEYLLRYAPPPARPATPALTSTAGQAGVVAAADMQGPRDGEPHLAWLLRLAIQRAGLQWLRISNPKQLGPADDPFGVQVEAWAPIELRRIVRGKVHIEEAPRLGDNDARRIALALRDITRRDLAPDWVQIKEIRNRVGVYSIQVNTEDVMARIRPYRESLQELLDSAGRPRWRRAAQPSYLLWGTDGMPIGVDLARHAQILGATQNGKSAYINREWADLTRCEDAVIWVCSTEKLYDLVGQWLEPYLGTDEQPPLDWVRADAQGVLDMLIAAMMVARWRQSQPFAVREGFVNIFLYIDEASFALTTNATAYYQGKKVNAGDLYAMCNKAVTSAGIYLIVATQRGVNHEFGDRGGDAVANVTRAIVLQTNDDQEIGRVTGNYKLPALQHRGECYAKPGDGDVYRAKIEYIQTTDPSKPVLHDGPKINEVAWNRRYFPRALDAGSAQAAGAAYAARPQYVTDAYLAELRGAPLMAPEQAPEQAPAQNPAQAPAQHTPEHDEEQAMHAAVTSIFSKLGGITLPAPAADSVPAAPVAAAAAPTPLAGYRTRADRVEAAARQIWRTHGTPAGRRDILAALHEAGDTAADPQLVSNALTQLCGQGRLVRPQGPDGRPLTGQYLPAEAATDVATVSNA